MSVAAAAYRATMPRHDAAEVVERHGELVRRIAHHLAARLPSSVPPSSKSVWTTTTACSRKPPEAS